MKKGIKTLVLYDGHCGFCRWAATVAVRLDAYGRLEPVALQTPGVLGRFNIPRAEAERALHVVAPDGSVHRAGEALRVMASKLPWVWPLRFLWRVPGFAWLADRAYFFIADHRGSLARVASRPDVPSARPRPERGF